MVDCFLRRLLEILNDTLNIPCKAETVLNAILLGPSLTAEPMISEYEAFV
jgi:hypothetical protein